MSTIVITTGLLTPPSRTVSGLNLVLLSLHIFSPYSSWLQSNRNISIGLTRPSLWHLSQTTSHVRNESFFSQLILIGWSLHEYVNGLILPQVGQNKTILIVHIYHCNSYFCNYWGWMNLIQYHFLNSYNLHTLCK